jgi:uncharacterized DUF497 family protein
MEVVFDQHKLETNRRKHGYDFRDLDQAYFDAATVFEAKKGRLMAIGWFGEIILAVIFQPLGSEAISVISMRPASRKERSLL